MPPESEAQAWWADVQHVRESIERRRALAGTPAAALDASTERRFSRSPADSLPQFDDLDWTSASPAYTGAHVDHTARPQRAEPVPSRRCSPRS